MQATITVVLSYIQPVENHNIEVTIFSDDAFHSQDPEELAKYPKKRFHNHKLPISQVPKTGLGSSAALVSVVTTALLSYYRPQLTENIQSDRESLDKIHNLAQLAHCTAQKKIGSGFDVASAVCGSIIYRRFKAETLGSLTSYEKYDGKTYSEEVKKLIDETEWNVQINPVGLPNGLSLLMGDICGGSETPKLVSIVLDWRKKQPERSLQVWTDLNNANMSLVALLEKFAKYEEENKVEYSNLLELIRNSSSVDIENSTDDNILKEFVDAFKKIRFGLKTMTKETGAPIEPDSQTEILDRCSMIPGVLGGVVPGAGGYDAVCLLVATESVNDIKANSKSDPILKNVKWLNLRQDNIGLTTGNMSEYM